MTTINPSKTQYRLRPNIHDKRANALAPHGLPRYVRIYDDGGKTLDQYTIVYTRTRNYLWVGCSANPYFGFFQHGEGKHGPIDRPAYAHLGKRITFSQLPPEAQRAILIDYRELWGFEASLISTTEEE